MIQWLIHNVQNFHTSFDFIFTGTKIIDQINCVHPKQSCVHVYEDLRVRM